jgi:hypothetical protein
MKDKKDEIIEELKEALGFYADTKNWEGISGHTRFMSNLKITDCAYFNCGGGRARLALKKVQELEQGSKDEH